MNKRPWFPLYTADWRGSRSVRLLKREARSMYLDLLCEIWEDGPIPDDPMAVASLLGENAEAFAIHWPGIRYLLFEVTPGHLSQRRIEEERMKADEVSSERSESGKKGAAARWNGNSHSKTNTKPTTQPLANTWQTDAQSQSQSQSDLSHSRETPPDQIWLEAVKLQPGAGLMDAWMLVTSAAPASGMSTEEYFSKALGVFVEWVDGCKADRRPQKSPQKFVEHFPRIQEILAGKRSASPPESVSVPRGGGKPYTGPRAPMAALAVGGKEKL